MSAAISPIVISVDFTRGNLGNRMLQYLAATRLAEHLRPALGEVAVANVRIPEFGIDIPDIAQPQARVLRYSSRVSSRLDLDQIAQEVMRRGARRIELRIYSSCVTNLPSVDTARALFPLPEEPAGYGDDVLLINVRGAEILKAVHSQYTVLPAEFYARIIAQSGLRPVFLGQVDGDSSYLNGLRAHFPGAEFVSSRGALADFAAIGRSKNIVLAVSTFSWLAGWMSHANRIIMPLSGFYNPLQYPMADMIPRDDPRYDFYLFPQNTAVPDHEIERAHGALTGRWGRLDPGGAYGLRTADLPPLSPEHWTGVMFRQGRRYLDRMGVGRLRAR